MGDLDERTAGSRAGLRLVEVSGAATIDGESLTGRQRVIIAALALHRDRAIGTEQLIDIVWSGEAPPAARQSLQNQITRLRQRFGADLIVTGADGYRLAGDVDLARYERTVRAVLDGPVRSGAVRDLAAAVATWRGEPYEDLLDHVPAEAERSQLRDLHDRAREHLAVCRLVTGDLDDAVTDLLGLVAEDPYRERRWTLLMGAHHLAGRRAAALAAYDRAASVFASELRTQPSATLTALRDRIAGGDAVTLAELTGLGPAVTAAPPVPEPAAGTADHRRGRARCRRHRLSNAR